MYFSWFWSLKVQDQGSRFWWEVSCRQLPFAVCLHGREREQGSSLVLASLLIRTLIPPWGLYPHESLKPNCLLTVPPPNAITLSVRASAYGFGSSVYIAHSSCFRCNYNCFHYPALSSIFLLAGLLALIFQ